MKKKYKHAVTENATMAVRESFAENPNTCALMCQNNCTVYSEACISA